MSQDPRAQFKQWLESGEACLQPLTLPQRELWENSPVPVADPANHICGVIEIKGPITPEQCDVALQRVIERQEALRISFLPGKQRPLQMVRATGTAVLGIRELAAGNLLEDLMLETYRQPFDLLQGPLYRVTMIRRGHHDHVLAFSFHHAIADGWSLGVFVQDLCTAYVMGLTGLRKTVAVGMMGLRNTLPPVAQTYTEWAAAERAIWQPAELARRTDFWKSQLAGASRIWRGVPEAAPLRRWVSAIPADLVRGVKALAVSHSTTIFSTLLAAFQLTLSKWTGHEDLVVGTPVANRNKEAVRETMGYFAGVVPLRSQVDPTQTFTRHLRTVSASTLDSFANAMPFAELAAALGDHHAAGEHSVFDVRFALQNHPVPDVVLPRIATKLRMRSTGTARFDLGCELTEIGGELEVVWLFKPHRFPASGIAELNDLFLAVLSAVANSPASRMAALTV
ncbi:MAG: condensation domain-containing protein [Verrucomicrobia bacterium]|nr:condensation domain-containing protein [Verrucomicrobiota bacterium]